MTGSCTPNPHPARPDAPVFTVTVAGPERHDGEAGYTYVLPAADADTARALAMAYHAAEHELRLTEIGIDGEHGLRWRWAFDPAISPDVVFIPAESFLGPPPWPQDAPGRAWNDMRSVKEKGAMLAVIAAEAEQLDIARAFGLPVVGIDFDATDDPAVPATVAALDVAQRRARRALAPGRPPSEGDDISAFILGMSHINALVAGIADRDLANGVDADGIGQVLVDANYHAVNVRQGTDDDAPEYIHRRLVVDHWSLLKAADCYRFQIAGATGTAAPAAYLTVGNLRTTLIDALGLDGDTYRLRPEWDAADGWPILDTRPAPVRRAETLIKHYQMFDGIEHLDSADWRQHAEDITADLLHWAHGSGIDPWLVVSRALDHFADETRAAPTAPETLRLLVATSATQGQRDDDFCFTLPGEIVYPGFVCDNGPSCGCERSLVGIESHRGTTTFTVAEVEMTRDELHRALVKAENMTEDDEEYLDVLAAAKDMLAVAARFPLGAVLGKTARRYRRRPALAPPGVPPNEPDDTEVDSWLAAATAPAPKPSYLDSCRRAATDQGLDPICEALRAAGIEFSIDQTGGFCMLVDVPTPHGFWLGITATEQPDLDPSGHWLVVRYPDDEEDDTHVIVSEALPTTELITLVHGHLSPGRPRGLTRTATRPPRPWCMRARRRLGR